MAGPYANSNANMDDKVVPQRLRDVTGRLKISRHQNVYEADFEYGKQVLRWEEFTNGAATITHLPGSGGVRMSVTSASGDITIRQSRPYHRYQPGKTMAMYTYVNMGTANVNQVQRVGFFDDSNGVFFEQANPAPATNNPFGMSCNLRSDIGGMPLTRSIPLNQWNGDRNFIDSIQWDRGQMLFVEYAWYGGGGVRFGIMIDSEPYILHQEANSNIQGRTVAWSRTGNLPVRYEQRNIGASVANDMVHYGVSVMVEGGVDDQRGFTYSYGMALGTPTRTVAAATNRFPVLSIRMRVMGTQEYTQATAACTAGTTTTLTAGTAAWTVNQWRGRCVNYIVSGVSYVARISSNTATVLTIEDVVIPGAAVAIAPVAGQNYTIGIINRGQLLPKRLTVSSSALAQCEVFFSTPTSPIVLTGASFVAMASLGSPNSFAERDVSATSFTGGERIKKFLLPAGGAGLQIFDLLDLFPLYNTLRGSLPDIMTLAVTTAVGVPTNVGADFDAQEAMS